MTWTTLPDPDLLNLRFRELRLAIDRSAIAPDVAQLYSSLGRRGLRFRPHVWLSTDWFSPDGIPGIAVPFYAAHPRLTRLERKMKGEAEGSSRFWRRRILRHEAGHAIDTAYGLRRRADWRAIFGKASKPYPSDYAARPASRRFVLHLGHWYAQSHPTEDFAETFAVWLQPRARWRRDYAGWPALEKLEFVDRLMSEVAGSRPRHSDRSIVAPIQRNRRSLGEHYRRNPPSVDSSVGRYDVWLRQAFANRKAKPKAASASVYLQSVRAELRRGADRQFGPSAYLFNHVADTLRRRARALDLVLKGNRREAMQPALRLHLRVMTDFLGRNRERYLL